MSAYGHEMEREYSDQSLLTTGGSETGSLYTTEEGIYMSSLAATVLISGLATLGISVFSLLIALTVMLNACERRNSGVLEIYRNAESYDYCRTFALHAEMNSLSADHFPEICMDINVHYIRKGQYRRDLEIAVGIAEDFFTSIGSKPDGRDVVLMDADDFLASETFYADRLMDRIKKVTLVEGSRDSNYLRHVFTLKLYLKLRSLQWPLILLSRRPQKLRNTTIEYLTSVGCLGWSSLIMRTDNETSVNHEEFLSRQRTMLQREGFRIKAVISSQIDALRGPYLGDRIFKLPNPIFRHTVEGDDIQIKRSDSLQQEV